MSSTSRHGIQVNKLLKRQGDQTKQFQNILNKKKQKKDRDRRRVAGYRKWLAKLEKKGDLEQYTIKDWYGERNMPQQEQRNEKTVSFQEQEMKQQSIPSVVEQDSVDDTRVPQQYSQPHDMETFQQVVESQKREKLVRLQERQKKHRKLTLRTRKGQPIMKYQIANLIEKLKK